MTLFVDTSVWSLAFRRDAASDAPEVRALRHALESGESIVTLLTTDNDFVQAATHCPLRVWKQTH